MRRVCTAVPGISALSTCWYVYSGPQRGNGTKEEDSAKQLEVPVIAEHLSRIWAAFEQHLSGWRSVRSTCGNAAVHADKGAWVREISRNFLCGSSLHSNVRSTGSGSWSFRFRRRTLQLSIWLKMRFACVGCQDGGKYACRRKRSPFRSQTPRRWGTGTLPFDKESAGRNKHRN